FTIAYLLCGNGEVRDTDRRGYAGGNDSLYCFNFLTQRGSVAPASVRQSDVAWSVFLALYCSSTPTSQHSRGSDSSGLLRLKRSCLCCVHVGLTVSSRALGPARSGSRNPSGWSQPYVFMDARSASEGGPNVT